MNSSVNLPWSRREFVLRGLSIAATAGSFTPFSSALGSESGEYDCLILGAGISGLTAAWQLNQWWGGRGRILVLEGSHRIGGRIHTLHGASGRSWELGAEYIHRSPDTVPLWKYVQHFGLQTETLPKMAQSRIYFPGRPDFIGGRRPVTASLLWNVVQAAAMYWRVNRYSGPDVSAGEWIRDYALPLNLDRGLGEDFVAMALTGHMPGTLEDLSIRGFASDRISEQLVEKNEYAIVGGYDRLVNSLAGGTQIALRTPVEKIEYGTGGVTVTSSDGRRFRAKTAVCTFSAGMLRDGGITFAPALHPLKRDALRAIKCGHHSKIIIPFRKRFWPENMSMAHLPWRHRRAGRTYFNLSHGNSRDTPVLSALYMGEDAMKLDSLSLEAALGEICADLDKMYPLEAPVSRYLHRDSAGRCLATRKIWKEDPFAKGGNSYLSTDSTQYVPVTQARATLARADLTPNLFWAGEATALTTQPASVHGANESGLRVAGEVYRRLSSLRPFLPAIQR